MSIPTSIPTIHPTTPSTTPDTAPELKDTPMTGRYVAALVLEAIIITLLWLLGQAYSS